MKRLLPLGVLFLFGPLCWPVHSSPSALDSKKSFTSPLEVFNAARTALAKDDLAALCECLTDESRDLLGGGLTVNVAAAKKIVAMAGSDDDQRLMKKLDEVMAKHGLPERNLRLFEPLLMRFAGSELPIRVKIARTVLAPVQDRNAYISELMATLHKGGPKGGGVGGSIKGSTQLLDVHVDGDHAKGVVIKKNDGKEIRSPILFLKSGDYWKIDMTVELNRTFNPKTKSK